MKNSARQNSISRHPSRPRSPWWRRTTWLGAAAIVLLTGGIARAVAEAPRESTDSYWIGVECLSLEGALRAHLDVPQSQGLLIGQVVPDAPAAKAGIRTDDVLLKANDQPLATTQDLLKAIADVGEKPLKLEVIHAGKTQSLSVTPVKRPAEEKRGVAVVPEGERDVLQLFLDNDGPDAKTFRFVRPGVIAKAGAAVRVPLPDDMSVTIIRQGKKPAQIIVKKGDEKWEVTDEDLSKLPEPVRALVEPLVTGTMPFRIEYRGDDGKGPIRLDGPRIQIPQHGEETERQLQRRLDDVTRRLEALERAANHGNGADDKPHSKD